MTRFVEQSIAKAGLLPLLVARRAGDEKTVREALPSLVTADLLALGAIADALRTEDVGLTVRVHGRLGSAETALDVRWVEVAEGTSELDVLRAVAIARIAACKGARIGVDWAQHGLELAQVALGFGASDLRGPITRKSGLPILDAETLKVKGQGMVDLRSIRKREIAALVTHAGRLPFFVDDERPMREIAGRVAPSSGRLAVAEDVRGSAPGVSGA